jgi:hypothetical protein
VAIVKNDIADTGLSYSAWGVNLSFHSTFLPRLQKTGKTLLVASSSVIDAITGKIVRRSKKIHG